MENLTTHDGKQYALPHGYGGVALVVPGGAITVGGQRLTLEQLEQLPTQAAALTAWINDSYAHPSPPLAVPGEPAPPVGQVSASPEEMPSLIVTTLVRLLYELPAPPEVRAGALRALAAMPNVANLGAVNGGQALRITYPLPRANKFPGGKLPPGIGTQTLVFDTATSMLASTTNYQGTITVITAEWTNDIPKIVK